MGDKGNLPIGSNKSGDMSDAVKPNYDLSGNNSSQQSGGKGDNLKDGLSNVKNNGSNSDTVGKNNKLSDLDVDSGLTTGNGSNNVGSNDIVSNNMDLSGGDNTDDPSMKNLASDKSGNSTGGNDEMSGDKKDDNSNDIDASDLKSKLSNISDQIGNMDLGDLGNNLKTLASKPKQSYMNFTDKASSEIESATKNSKIKISKTVAKHTINIAVSGMLGFGGFGVWSLVVHHKNVVDDDNVCLTQNTGDLSYSSALSGTTTGTDDSWLQEGTEQNKNAKAVIALLKELGFSGVGIAGVLGNIRGESGFNTDILNQNGNGGQGDGGKGLMQWTNNPPDYTEGRRNELEATAKSMGKSSSDLEVQIAQIKKDLTNSAMWVSAYKSPFTPQAYNASSSPADAALWFYLSQFEAGGAISYDKDGSATNRQMYAQQAYAYFNLADVKSDSSKLSSLLGGENQTVADSNASLAETANSLLCSTGSSTADTSSIVSTAQSLIGYFSYSQATRTNFVKSGNYSDISSIDNVKKDGNADCSSFVWLVLKLAGYNVPDACWATPSMESDAKGSQTYLKQIDSSEAKAGDIVIVNLGSGSGNNGHTAILLEDWHGNDTKVIDEGGSQPGGSVHEGTFSGEFYPSLEGGTVTFARAIKK